MRPEVEQELAHTLLVELLAYALACRADSARSVHLADVLQISICFSSEMVGSPSLPQRLCIQALPHWTTFSMHLNYRAN
jgi:hypothetical protein